MMEVAGAEPLGDDALSISTGIVIVGGMKGLMEVADKIEDEFQGDQPFFGIGTAVRCAATALQCPFCKTRVAVKSIFGAIG
jgi:hypothetical protein